MRMYPFPQKAGWKAFLCVGMLAILMLSRDCLYSAICGGFYVSTFISYGILAAIGLAFLAVNLRQLHNVFTDFRILIAVICTLVFLVPMVVKVDYQLMYFSVLICVYTGILLSYFVPLKRLARYYCGIGAVLAAYSVLAAFWLRLLPDAGILSVPIAENSIGTRFYFMGASFVCISPSHRNFGIFREPGVYQFFLILGMYLNNYQTDWEKPWQLWTINGIFAVTMISTVATGGVIEMALLAGILLFEKGYYRRRWVRHLVLFSVCVLFISAAASWGTKNELDMFIRRIRHTLFFENDSRTARVDSIVSNMKFFLNSPFVGDKFDTVIHGGGTTIPLLLHCSWGSLALAEC